MGFYENLLIRLTFVCFFAIIIMLYYTHYNGFGIFIYRKANDIQVKAYTLTIIALRKSNEYWYSNLNVRGCAFFGA